MSTPPGFAWLCIKKAYHRPSPLRTARVISRDNFRVSDDPRKRCGRCALIKNASRAREGHGARWWRSPLPRRRSPLSHRPRARVIAASRPAHRRYRSGPPPPRRRSSPRCPTRTSAASWTARRSSRCRTPSAGRSSARRSSADPGSSSSQTSRTSPPTPSSSCRTPWGTSWRRTPGSRPSTSSRTCRKCRSSATSGTNEPKRCAPCSAARPPCPPTRARANERCGTIPS
mmetsp:Transcript_5273/g.21522  ORF Transcript_5273/g.21522 Transcript_5273/m.21522 type:complete len:229 (-) Transcript_5273:2367-3053(-)